MQVVKPTMPVVVGQAPGPLVPVVYSQPPQPVPVQPMPVVYAPPPPIYDVPAVKPHIHRTQVLPPRRHRKPRPVVRHVHNDHFPTRHSMRQIYSVDCGTVTKHDPDCLTQHEFDCHPRRPLPPICPDYDRPPRCDPPCRYGTVVDRDCCPPVRADGDCCPPSPPPCHPPPHGHHDHVYDDVYDDHVYDDHDYRHDDHGSWYGDGHFCGGRACWCIGLVIILLVLAVVGVILAVYFTVGF